MNRIAILIFPMILGCVSAQANPIETEKANIIIEIIKGNKGNEGGHSGDLYVLEFSTLAQFIADQLTKDIVNSIGNEKLTIETFQNTVESVKVISADKDRVVLNGAPVDAINFSQQKLILVNRDHWREMNLHQKIKVVLHEYFGILDIEKSKWTKSVKLIDFTFNLSQQIASDIRYADLMINFNYGLVRIHPPLTAAATCDTSSRDYIDAQRLAEAEAKNKCIVNKLGGTCSRIKTTYSSIISTTLIGYRYCEIVSVYK